MFLADFSNYDNKENDRKKNIAIGATVVGVGGGLGAALSEDYVANKIKPFQQRLERLNRRFTRRIAKATKLSEAGDYDALRKMGNGNIRHSTKYKPVIDKTKKEIRKMNLAKKFAIPAGVVGGAALGYGAYRGGKAIISNLRNKKDKK